MDSSICSEMGSAAAAWELPAGRMSLRLLPNVGGGGTTSSGPSLIARSLVFGRRGGCKQLAATMCQRWLLRLVSLPSSLYFSPAPPAPLPAPAEAEAARPRHWGAPPRQRTAPFGPGSTAPRSASGGRGGHIDFGKRCFWVALPAGVWSRATTEWIEALGAGLTALNGNPNHVDYAANSLLTARSSYLTGPRHLMPSTRDFRSVRGLLLLFYE